MNHSSSYNNTNTTESSTDHTTSPSVTENYATGDNTTSSIGTENYGIDHTTSSIVTENYATGDNTTSSIVTGTPTPGDNTSPVMRENVSLIGDSSGNTTNGTGTDEVFLHVNHSNDGRHNSSETHDVSHFAAGAIQESDKSVPNGHSSNEIRSATHVPQENTQSTVHVVQENNIGTRHIRRRASSLGNVENMDTGTLHKIDDVVHHQNWTRLVEYLDSLESAECVTILQSKLSSLQRMDFFRILTTHEERCRYFPILRSSEMAVILSELPLQTSTRLVQALPASLRLEIVRELPYGTVQQLLSIWTEDELQAASFFESFPQNSLGKHMRPISSVPVLSTTMTLREAALALERQPAALDTTVPLILVVDENQCFRGLFRFSSALRAAMDSSIGNSVGEPSTTSPTSVAPNGSAVPERPLDYEESGDSLETANSLVPTSRKMNAEGSILVADVMEPADLVFSPYDNIEDFLNTVRNRRVPAAPVVDEDGCAVGVVTSPMVMTLFEKQALHRYEAVAALEPLEKSFSKSSVFLLYRKRIVWLLLLVVVSLGTAFIIGSFDGTLSKNVVLASFIPLLSGMGGNTGSQSAALIIQALASHDISRADYFRAIRKEATIGCMLGVTLGLAGWVLGFVRGNVNIGVVVGIALFCVVQLSNLMGYTLPFLAVIFKIDPAVSVPLVTTAIDMISVAIFFGFSLLFL